MAIRVSLTGAMPCAFGASLPDSDGFERVCLYLRTQTMLFGSKCALLIAGHAVTKDVALDRIFTQSVDRPVCSGCCPLASGHPRAASGQRGGVRTTVLGLAKLGRAEPSSAEE